MNKPQVVKTPPPTIFHCNFCGKSNQEVAMLIHGKSGKESVFACNECVDLMTLILAEKRLGLRT